MADAENGQKIDPDATNVFDEEGFDDRIPYSVSYFMICIVLPVMNGLLNSFAWSAYALYARKNGWNLSLAGLAISIGCGGRLIVQQVIFRAGIWTCFIFAVVQLTVASMAIAYPAEAIVVYVQVACIPAFDVTVAIEGLAFDTWSDSEAQVGQAQSTVLSIFTIAYAMAATFGGVIYDAGSWTGISLFHLTCSLVQLLVFVAQPAMLKSFWEFIHRIRGDDDEDEDDEDEAHEDEDEVKELGDQVTSIVPGPKVSVVPVPEVSPLGPSAQSGPSGASGPSGPSGGKAEEMAALPGAVEEEADPRATAPEKETQIVLPEKEALPSDDPDGVQNAAHSEGDARAARAQASRRASARSAASKSSRRRKTANSESPEDDEEHERRSRALISPNLARSSILTGHSSRSSVSSHVSQPRRRNQRLTVATHGTLATHRTGHTHASGRTANTTRSTRTMETVMTNLSKFTALTEMGEHFQYNFGIQNGLRPHIATNAVEMAVQSDDEEEHPEHLLYVQRAQTRAERKAALEEERKKRKEAKGEGEGKDKGVRLCIRNIAEEVTAEKLRELMEPFDTILAVILRCDEETGKNRGVGFVVMSSMEGATKAIEELNGQELEGKPLNVAFSERRGRGERADGSTAKGKAEGKGKGGGRGKGKGKGGKGVAATIIPGPLSPFQAPPMMRPMGPMPGMPSMPVSGMPGGMPVYPFPQGPRGVPSMPGMPGMRPFGVPGQMPHPMPHAMPHRPMMPMPGAPGAPMPGMPAPMPPPAALGPFNKEAIEKMPPQQQKQQLGERLYASNFRLRPDLAGKLTGMMLELSNTEILGLLESDEKLKHKIDEAVKILDQKK